MYNDVEWLAGHRIDKVYVDSDHVAFVTDAGLRSYETYGDCCSRTWMADIIDFDKVAGKVIAKVEDGTPDGYEIGKDREVEEDQVYGVKLIAADGSVAYVIYVNSSNGYYGGSIGSVENGTLKGLLEVTSSWRSESTK